VIPPHSVLIPGVIVLNDGPLHVDDLADLRRHFERNGIRPRNWVVFVTEDQLRWMVAATGLFQHGPWDHTDPLMQRWPGMVGMVFGITICRATALGMPTRPQNAGPWMTMRQPTAYTVATATNGTRVDPLPTIDFDADAFKIRLDTDIAGKWFDKAWLDEKKPQPAARTSHEVW
jgi:hypothetical protein